MARGAEADDGRGPAVRAARAERDEPDAPQSAGSLPAEVYQVATEIVATRQLVDKLTCKLHRTEEEEWVDGVATEPRTEEEQSWVV